MPRKRARGTKHRGGTREQARRDQLASSTRMAEAMTRFWSNREYADDRAFMIRVFGRPVVDDWASRRDFSHGK